MRKTGYILLVSFLLVNVCLNTLTIPSNGSDAETLEKAFTYINGNWDVTGTEVRANETIVLTGNLTIYSGGNLTFKNVTLKMNCSFDGEYHIEVQTGGELYIYDNEDNNESVVDASMITANNTDYRYMFWIKDGGYVIIRNSELHWCGYNNANKGITIESDMVIIEHCTISNNYYGLYLYYSDALISNNTITSNYGGYGIRCEYSSPIIKNNIITSHSSNGICCDKYSNATIVNNTVINNYVGIGIQNYSNALLFDNNISSNDDDGIFCIYYATATVIDCIILDNTFLGVGGTGTSFITIINSTISNNSNRDISLSSSWFTTINTTFNETKVYFGDGESNLTVKWYLNTKVIDIDNNSVASANVVVKNVTDEEAYNGTTDSDGYVRWIPCIEYVQNQTTTVYHTPHTIYVEKNGVSNNTTIWMNESKDITLALNVTSVTYINGDWDVTGTEVRSNETIILTGNLTIQNGGNLTFHNVTLKMNCSYDGQYHIEVLSGGEFYIYDNDNDNITTEDTSNITSNTVHRYLFWVRENAKMEMRNSELHRCGWDWDNKGLVIYSNNVTVDHCLISNDNYIGVSAYGSEAVISNNTITENGWYGIYFKNSDLTIENNVITAPSADGIAFQDSSPTITNNKISNAYEGIVWNIFIPPHNPKIVGNIIFSIIQRGVDAHCGTPSITNNIIQDIYGTSDGEGEGIHLDFGAYAVIDNTTIALCQKEGIDSSTASGIVVNSTFYMNSDKDIFLRQDDDLMFLNTTFNSSKISIASSSRLIVQNYLHVKVVDNHSYPIQNADVKITDVNETGYEQTVYCSPGFGGSDPKTDNSGMIKWIPVTDRIYKGSNTATENTTRTEVKYNNFTFIDNPRDVNMSNSHTEVFTANQALGIPTHLFLSAIPATLTADGTSPSKIIATVTNEIGTSIEGITVNLTIESGSGNLSANNNITDINGNATIAYTAGTIAGNVIINATANGIWNITTITLTPGPPANITIIASPKNIVADGFSTSAITARVTDLYGNPIPNVGIDFINETGLGSIDPISNVTDVNGNTTTIYTAGTITGNEIINVTNATNNVWNTITITLIAWQPTNIMIIAIPDTLIVNSGSVSTITATVMDQYGNPIPNVEVNFLLDTNFQGSIYPISNFTNAQGKTSSVYTAGTSIGNEIINATVSSIFNTITIELIFSGIAKIVIEPVGPKSYYKGDYYNYIAVGYDSFGNINTSWTPYWHIDGNIGIINDESGFFIATNKGSGAVNCTDTVTGVYNISIVNVLNSKPIFLDVIYINQTAYEGQPFTLLINAYDPDNDTTMFSDNSTLFDINSTTGLISFIPNYDSAGIYYVNITISDGTDFVWQIFKLKIINVNRAPAAVISSPAQNAKFTTNDNIFFDASDSSDPDNDNLIYTWTSSIDGTIGSTASFNKKLSKGTHTITLTVDDGQGGTDIKQIIIVVKKPTSEPSGGFIPGFETTLLVSVYLLAVIIILLRKRKT